MSRHFHLTREFQTSEGEPGEVWSFPNRCRTSPGPLPLAPPHVFLRAVGARGFHQPQGTRLGHDQGNRSAHHDQ
jgi:hypothetical protein